MAGARPKTSPTTPENAFVQAHDEESDEEGENETINNITVSPARAPKPPKTVPQDPVSVSTPRADVTGRAFFEKLRKDDPFKEEDMFKELEQIFNACKVDYGAESAEGKTPEGEEFVIQKVVDDFVYFNRVASVYTKGMHNMFIVSVWAASYDKHSGIGYVLSPKLTPLREMLEKVRNCGNENVHKQAMRKCFLPIAMAIDGLHTPVPNIRTMYYHRDICLDNIYIPSVIHGGAKDLVYGCAKLKLTKSTRGSHENEGIDVTISLNNSAYPLNAKYFHHPDPWDLDPDKMHQYLKRHDWFSFGVYMLEVMGLLLGHPLLHDDLKDRLQSQEKILYFVRYGEELKEIVTDRKFTNDRTREHYTVYLGVAMSCIEVEKLGELHHVDFPYEPEACKYYFEYPLFEPTARLLCFFDHSGSKKITLQDALIEQAKPKDDPPKGVSYEPKYVAITCQACQLRKTVAVPTRSYKRGSHKAEDPKIKVKASKCDENCNQTYCIQCYVNGERLFCPRGYKASGSSVGHGTTSTVIGHHSSYALILNGEHFMNPKKLDLFEKDADMLANVLTHRLICGMREGNIVRKALYSDRRTAEGCLEEACTEMMELIHRRQWNPATHLYDDVTSCVNDSDFCVFVFYSGHGGGEDTEIPLGSWVPKATLSPDLQQIEAADVITPDTINRLMKPIRNCSDTETCEGCCVEVVYLMDHCRASEVHELINFDIFPPWTKNSGKTGFTEKPPRAVVVPVSEQESFTLADGTHSEITYWFCVLMRSLFFAECSKEKEDCSTCRTIKDHIEHRCFGAFIDAHCLELHMQHMNNWGTQYKSNVTARVDVPRSKTGQGQFILAHYNEGGVYHRVFPYLEEHDVVEMNFAEKTHCASIIKQIESKVGPNKGIRLLTNNPSDSSKFNLVCDHNVKDILHSTSKIVKCRDDKQVYPSILYYQIIRNPVTVVLKAKAESAEDKFELCLDVGPTYKMVNEMLRRPNRMQIPAGQLPNILVYVVWHLRHLDDYLLDPATLRRLASGGSITGQTNAPREDNYSTQVATASDEERVRNSFATYLYETKRADPVDLKVYTPKQWYDLEDLASRYLNPGREKVFKVDSLPNDVISIEWPVYDTDTYRDMTAVAMTASS